MFSKPKDQSGAESAAESTAERAAVPRATYEIDDFAVLDGNQVAELMARADTDVANQVPGCAHLVVTCDLRTGLVTHHVPCSSGREALVLAAQLLAEKREKHPKRTYTVKVTPLLPH